MLVRLYVENVALTERIELSVGPGLTVLTGETGAGKSLVVDALSLLAGARGALDFIRSGAPAAVIEAVFRVQEAALFTQLEERGIPNDEGEIVWRRLLSRDGRHRTFINGAQVPAALAASVCERLLDIHAQHEQQVLLHPAAHLEILDSAAGIENEVRLYRERYAQWRALVEEEESLRREALDRERRLDFVRFQLEEIAAVAPQVGEREELEAERRRLENADRLAAICNEADEILYTGEGAVRLRLRVLAKRFEEAARFDERFQRWANEAGELSVRAEELAREVAEASRRIESDPARLDALHARLDALDKMRRKYGPLDQLPQQIAALKAERERLEDSESRLASVSSARTIAEQDLRAFASKLHALREAAVQTFCRRLEKALRPLGMRDASVEARLAIEPALGPSGSDRVEILLSANRGEPAKPLQKVASGGELSRVMLALHTLALQAGGPACVIFDEIDAGIGGEVGEAIGKALRKVAERRQVLCVTHLPQIAVYGHNHWIVRKRVVAGRTVSEVRPVTGDERLEEIGRMLGGIVDAAAREHARALIERAGR